MKKASSYLFILMVLVIAQSCKKDTIMLYEGDTYLQFSRNVEDSSTFSFLALPDDDQAQTPISVELVGKPADHDRSYKISVMTELSTAPASNYVLPDKFVFRAGKVIDTAWLTLNKTPEIAVAPVKLVLRLEATDDFKVGQTNYAFAILYISNVIARPDWWNGTVEGRFLGGYSDKKYELFIQVAGRSEINGANLDEVRYYTMMLKNYLLQEKDAGRTVYEDNGEEMTVALIGG
ncbi:MAG: DUF4843 domain-containing protein [Candidatus Pseudobacter hemicellulosilyticus]|uniref:DUF4843 domain-containing protein n=1 Tax=Candidatus Pseudobacter hemicellulosilyticus TaxID=3121375 RepID=A0AAJ5WN69_9BACT|nr:MAG: DUF4843 domain-containing protein [Pseudobacter sp.]